jgi:uncharacterized protein (DUF488 family)
MALVYTIGHSKHDITDFLSLLKEQEIKVVIDVRSEPFSRRMPQFSKSELERFLKADGFEYLYMGEELGGHPKDTSLYTPRVILDYDRITNSQAFISKMNHVVDIAQSQVVVLMCAEGLPTRCHRESLLGSYLRSKGHRVLHILPDGDIRENQQLILL